MEIFSKMKLLTSLMTKGFDIDSDVATVSGKDRPPHPLTVSRGTIFQYAFFFSLSIFQIVKNDVMQYCATLILV